MIGKIALSALLLCACSLIQSTWLGPLAILGVKPDLGLITLIWLAYRNGPVEGTSAAFVSGLIDDTISAAPFGLNAFTKTLIAWFASFLHGAIYLDHFILPAILGASATFAKAGISILLAMVFSGTTEAYDLLGKLFWIETAYNACLAPILFAVLGLSLNAFGTKDRKARL
jgi:rod shape-determining protein MreD